MGKRMELNRPQRVARLATLNAPVDLLANEIRLAINENLDADLATGMPQGFAWSTAAWGLVVLLQGLHMERRELRAEVRRLRRKLKEKEVAT